MPFPTIVEKYGSLSATGFAKETTFGTPVAANTFLPMTSNTMEMDPGWFSPPVMFGKRDLQVFNMQGEYKFNGAVGGPLFPSNAMEILSASIGADAQTGAGVTGTPSTPTSTTLSAPTIVGATTITVTSGTGFVIGQQVAVDVGALMEVRRISNVVTNTITLSDPLNYAHSSGVAAVTAGTTTLAALVTAPTSTITVTSATGITTNTILQIDTNSPSGGFTSEVRKVTNVVTTTVTLDSNLTYNHASGAVVTIVTTPYIHTFSQANTLPSLTVEKNVGGFQSLQFAGCRVSKFDLKCPVGNNPADVTADFMGQSVAVLNSPTAINVTNEIPYVFAEAYLYAYGSLRTDAHNIAISIDNGLKETYTYSGNHGPSFITPVTVKTNGTFDVVWSSFNDATYGDFVKMQNATLGTLSFALQHPTGGSMVRVDLPQIALAKYANDVKMTDVIMTTLSYEASNNLGTNTNYTVQATVSNNVYLPY